MCLDNIELYSAPNNRALGNKHPLLASFSVTTSLLESFRLPPSALVTRMVVPRGRCDHVTLYVLYVTSVRDVIAENASVDCEVDSPSGFMFLGYL